VYNPLRNLSPIVINSKAEEPMSFTSRNHYVPQWYQRRFLIPGDREAKFFYLDLRPDEVFAADGRPHKRRALLRWGPPSCFKQDHLYTTRFGQYHSDEIERRLFGPIDAAGERAIPFFDNYEFGEGAGEAFQDLMDYMDVQKLRTPKGLDLLQAGARVKDHNQLLFLMQGIRRVHVTIWTEGVWEIVSCRNSNTKFIVSDHPVAAYNRQCFPGSVHCRYPLDPQIDMVGTHTIFPLGLEHCLFITNLESVRDLDTNPLRTRTNARAFQQPTPFMLTEIQTGRELSETDVQAVNYIMKSRARRYVAAARQDWLYPERYLATTHWSKLGSEYFLAPDSRLVKFTTGIAVGHKGGARFATDEYGRPLDENNPVVKRQRDQEWKSYQRANKVFERLRGPIAPEVYQRML
jgi:hypothetical protein